ncbi:MAG: glycosyltransferase [Minisyncoccia bacterium]
MKIAFIFDKQQEFAGAKYVYRVLQAEGHETAVFKFDQLKQIPDYKPDLVLAMDDGAHYICDIDIHPKAIWIIDTHLSYLCDEVMVKSFDIIFSNQKNDSERLGKKFKYVYWLPVVADPELHGPVAVPKKEFDIAMVGGLFRGTRKVMMRKLKELYPNSYIGGADWGHIGEIYSKSKIVVNYAIENGINNRAFEGPCSGSLLITNKLKDNGLEDLFEDGKEIVTYSDFSDLKNKIDYYLAHNEERERIAAAGRARVLKEHTYKDRVDFMLSKINELRPQLATKKESQFHFNKLKLELKFKRALWFVVKVLRRIKWKIQELVS